MTTSPRQEYFRITGGNCLGGEVVCAGNKNAVLPMIAASILTDRPVVLHNVPQILDVEGMLRILAHLGVHYEREGTSLRIEAKDVSDHAIPRELCAATRTSFLFVGPLLARVGKARVFPPGGDVIGRRRLDAHFYGLSKMGADVDERDFIFSTPQGLTGRDLFFDEASVTATEHILMAAVLATGTTIIRNAASEPHVQDLARMLVAMGAQIEGINTNTLSITGVDSLSGCEHEVTPDHIEAGSFLALAAATGGELTVRNTVRSHWWMTNRVFERFGVQLHVEADHVFLPSGQEPRICRDVGGVVPRVDDGPWPQFPSDLMSIMIVLATQSEGTVLFFEKMYESRLYFVDRLIQMGASAIVCDPHRVVINGRSTLRAQNMASPDIRAGMALLMAAMCARGVSEVHNAWVIDRGYERLEHKLTAIGAAIERVSP
jgi:UDP-N-acetylglucosamine 1-carboxyvinyltransferase